MGVDANTSDSVYFDDFESRRFSYIGLLASAGPADPEPTAQPSWLAASYAYDAAQPHAVTSVERDQAGGGTVTDSYEYDSNGNMTCRVEGGTTYKHSYNAENRLSKIEKVTEGTCSSPTTISDTWEFFYDGDGTRVKEIYYLGGTEQYTRIFFGGGVYEVTLNSSDVVTGTKKYYSFAGSLIAMDDGTDLVYFAADHLSSASLVMDDAGNLISEQRYMPFGEVREDVSYDMTDFTDFGYTGQRDYGGDFGLMDYRSRFLSTRLGRFTQPDSIVPDPSNPQAWNRFTYVNNNPLNYNDPSGHCGRDDDADKTDACEAIKKQIESTYKIKIEGKWTLEEIELVYQTIANVAALVGGDDVLNDLIQDTIDANGGSENWITIKREMADAAIQKGGRKTDGGWWDGSIIHIVGNAFNFEGGDRARRPPGFGVDTKPASARITIAHELAHAIVDGNPELLENFEYAGGMYQNFNDSSSLEETFASAFALIAELEAQGINYYDQTVFYDHRLALYAVEYAIEKEDW